ncbi:DUF4810 domain-containing protein [Pseudoalteromonas sp. T1lg22]|uniref:DUF4810 domain-containing protein n=1 Tax=Pseudoalteromonas sp. T1lg22 TaxID=2077096 RepID=UPI000CF72FCB|nr:DUF4810 domain-containing protein [Pseudoalteromonas sp. T1lg22]
MKKLITAAIFAVAATGCKTVEPLYYYGNYNSSVYDYFKADNSTIEEQIAALETVIEQASAKGKAIAPGIHAHLGMLYFETGNNTQGMEHFEQEKFLFPESAQYIDFLIKSAKEV